MGLQDLFNWHAQTATQTTPSMPAVTDEELPADVDEPPDHSREETQQPDFHKSTIRLQISSRKVSLLTKALMSPELEPYKTETHTTTDMSRRRSLMSNASLASTAELTSDGGLTSPARTNTPSPPFPNTPYTSFAPFSLAAKPMNAIPVTNGVVKESIAHLPETISVSPKTKVTVEVAPKKRCITFACGGRKSPATKQVPVVQQPLATVAPVVEAPKRKCMIKFACGEPKPSDKVLKVEAPKSPQPSKATEASKRNSSRSPSITRKSPRPVLSTIRPHRDSTSTIRRASQSPLAIRAKPKYIIADEKTLQNSEATRFHEFAAGELQEDDWIRKESDIPREKLTISDTLKKENAIRRLGNEAEEEALEEAENEDDDDDDEDDQDGNDSDEENDSDDENNSDEDENDVDSLDGSDEEASDGNETDNEAGFAESDDESDDGEFAFWTPGRQNRESRNPINYRASAHRTASVSSNESHGHARRPPRRPLKIRPGTPDLPDSTDFVCGTLDEDRPLEDAYVSCMEARRMAKHKKCPQDIDPSFPTSDPEDEEDKHDNLEPANDSDDHVWIHGKFEDSDEELHGRHRSAAGRRKSQSSPRRLRSPPPPARRLHSPPPTKTRLRSPPPRKLFGHSPKRMRSPPPARTIRSPPASPSHVMSGAISFAPLGSRPGLTHTKSLPRTPNAFCRQYHAARLIAANGNNADDANDGHVRGAIDIVKGLEQKRQGRKEKFYQKNCNRKNKGDRKPQPGKGAERMEQLGLLLSGKTGPRDPYMMSA